MVTGTDGPIRCRGIRNPTSLSGTWFQEPADLTRLVVSGTPPSPRLTWYQERLVTWFQEPPHVVSGTESRGIRNPDSPERL